MNLVRGVPRLGLDVSEASGLSPGSLPSKAAWPIVTS